MSEAGHTAALAPSNANTKRLSTIAKPSGSANGAHTSPSRSKPAALPSGGTTVKDVVSPGELCAFVDSLLTQLETRFDEMSDQILGRMDEMSSRIDNLETSIQDLMHSGIEGGSPSPSPAAKR